MSPLKTSSGLALGGLLTPPEKNDNGAVTAEERNSEASSIRVLGLRFGMEVKTYDLFHQESFTALRGPSGGYDGSEAKVTEISLVSVLYENCGRG
jgi:hypothetical protein